jgi:hypothetical protein
MVARDIEEGNGLGEIDNRPALFDLDAHIGTVDGIVSSAHHVSPPGRLSFYPLSKVNFDHSEYTTLGTLSASVWPFTNIDRNPARPPEAPSFPFAT